MLRPLFLYRSAPFVRSVCASGTSRNPFHARLRESVESDHQFGIAFGFVEKMTSEMPPKPPAIESKLRPKQGRP
jgi:hypothetical protein